jgi:hypothetical protein
VNSKMLHLPPVVIEKVISPFFKEEAERVWQPLLALLQSPPIVVFDHTIVGYSAL